MTAAITATAGVLALAGCASGATERPSDTGRLRVVATTTQLGDFASEVGGERIELTTLLGAGDSAHQFDPSPAQLLALSRADALVVNGAGLEGFLDSAIEASGFHGTVITAADGIDLDEARRISEEAEQEAVHLRESDEEHAAHADADADAGRGAAGRDDHDHDSDHDHAHDSGQDEQGADHDHADDGGISSGDHDGHDGHDHGDLNPHLWTSVRFARGMVDEIARGFGALDPEHAADYAERAERASLRLERLDEWIAAQFERIPESERLFVSGHDSLRYYLHDYGIAFVGALLPSFDDHAEPSVAAVDALIRTINRHGVRAVFTESSINPKLAQTVAAETGAHFVGGENALYADSLGAAGSGAETYLGATVHNTRTILEAWGYTPDPLPEELR